MVRELLDPWFLLTLHEMLCWALLGIVILEGVCMLFLCVGPIRLKHILGRRQPAVTGDR
jgi:hypothetical protein